MDTTSEALPPRAETKKMSLFERYLTLWVGLCIVARHRSRQARPGLAAVARRDGASTSSGAPVVSIPIAICLFFMMYPIMVKIDFAEVVKAGKSAKPVGPHPVRQLGDQALHHVRDCLLVPRRSVPRSHRSRCHRSGQDAVRPRSAVGASYGAGTVVMDDGVKMLEVPLWRSYLAGLHPARHRALHRDGAGLGLSRPGQRRPHAGHGRDQLADDAGALRRCSAASCLGVGKLPVPWQALLLSIGIYVALPLVAGYLSRRWIIAAQGARRGSRRSSCTS